MNKGTEANTDVFFEEYTSNDLSKQMDGFLMNQEVSIGFDIGEQLNHASSPSGP